MFEKLNLLFLFKFISVLSWTFSHFRARCLSKLNDLEGSSLDVFSMNRVLDGIPTENTSLKSNGVQLICPVQGNWKHYDCVLEI